MKNKNNDAYLLKVSDVNFFRMKSIMQKSTSIEISISNDKECIGILFHFIDEDGKDQKGFIPYTQPK